MTSIDQTLVNLLTEEILNELSHGVITSTLHEKGADLVVSHYGDRLTVEIVLTDDGKLACVIQDENVAYLPDGVSSPSQFVDIACIVHVLLAGTASQMRLLLNESQIEVQR